MWALLMLAPIVGVVLLGDVKEMAVDLQEGARELGWVAIAIWMPLYVLIACGLPANTISCVLAGLFYGWWAVLLCLVWGALCASSIAFVLCRRCFRAPIERLVDSKRLLTALKLAVEDKALLVTMVARICPVVPFGQVIPPPSHC